MRWDQRRWEHEDRKRGEGAQPAASQPLRSKGNSGTERCWDDTLGDAQPRRERQGACHLQLPP